MRYGLNIGTQDAVLPALVPPKNRDGIFLLDSVCLYPPFLHCILRYILLIRSRFRHDEDVQLPLV